MKYSQHKAMLTELYTYVYTLMHVHYTMVVLLSTMYAHVHLRVSVMVYNENREPHLSFRLLWLRRFGEFVQFLEAYA